jgi:NAD(P)-dependent dehydrogenase (short-subunit alcohol dehydrogenase family)
MAGIQDKVVAITGASSRIGEAAAVMLAERGAKVVIRLHFLARSFPQLTDRRVCSSHPWTAVHFQRAKVVLGTRGLDRLEASGSSDRGIGWRGAYARTDARPREDVPSLINLAYDRYGQLALALCRRSGR